MARSRRTPKNTSPKVIEVKKAAPSTNGGGVTKKVGKNTKTAVVAAKSVAKSEATPVPTKNVAKSEATPVATKVETTVVTSKSTSKSKSKPAAAVTTTNKSPKRGKNTTSATTTPTSPAKPQAPAKREKPAPTKTSTTKKTTPTVPTKRRKISEINAIPTRCTQVGTVFVFGTGDCAQLGLGEDMVERKKPMPLQDLVDENIVDVFVGGLHNLALSKDGKLFSWGCNDQKALGRAGDEYEPAPVEGLEDVKIVKVACGDSVTVALSEEGNVYTCGTYRSAEGILGFAKGQEVQATLTLLEPLVKAKVKVVDISAGVDHVLALTATGDVYGWGNGQQNQLGRRIIERRKINGLRPEKLGLKQIVKIGTGSYHSFAIDVDGVVYAWGLNNFHQCGLESEDGGDEEIVPTPTIIETFEGMKIQQIIGGEHHSLALTESGEVYGFGRSDSSQLGLPANLAQDEEGNEASHKKAVGTPTKIPGLSAIKFLACGSNHNIALSTTGDAYSWGFGESLALGNAVEEDVETPMKIEGQKITDVRILTVGAGGQHSVLLGVSNK